MKIKTKTTNKIISFLLIFCMIFSMIPNIFAADTVTTIFHIEKFYDEIMVIMVIDHQAQHFIFMVQIQKMIPLTENT